jgi:hypothetical protein
MAPVDSRSDIEARLNKFRPSLAFVVMIFGALIAFEIFNFSTTDHALTDLLGDLTFAGLPWSTMLAVAFCGIDFAGIARLFTPEQGLDEPKEVWYLFVAWLLAATMNAILTWWGVSIAVASHSTASATVVDAKTISSVVPIFVAIMVWVIRILIIGTLSLSLDRMMNPGKEQHTPLSVLGHTGATPAPALATGRGNAIPAGLNSSAYSARPATGRPMTAAPRPSMRTAAADESEEGIFEPAQRGRPEATYHSISGSPRPNNGGNDRFRR